MAKRTRFISPAEQKIEERTDDMAQMLDAARARAEGWLSQKHHIKRHLEGIRDTASALLEKMGHSPAGRPANVRQVTIVTGQSNNLRNPRTISAEGRARIAEAQRKRWAAQKAAQEQK